MASSDESVVLTAAQVRPIQPPSATSQTDGSPQGPLLELESDGLQSTRRLDLSGNSGTCPRLEPAECRSSNQVPAHRQLAPGQDNMVRDGIPGGIDADAPELARSGQDHVVSSEAGQTADGRAAVQALEERARMIVKASGFMPLITDELPVAKYVSNELLLRSLELLLTLTAPDAAWAKRAFKEKMLAMLLALSVGFGSFDFVYAEEEGKRLMQKAKAVQASVKSLEKQAARAAKAKDPADASDPSDDKVSKFLLEECTSAFKVAPPTPEEPEEPEEQEAQEEQEPETAEPHPAHVPAVSDGLFSEEHEFLKAGFAQLEHDRAENYLLFQEQCDLMEQQANALNLRRQQMGIDWRGKMRDMREKRVLEKEIASMECEASEISRKRLRDEVADLKAEVKFEQEKSSRLDDENTGLLIQLEDLREKLAEAHADVDDLLEFKSRMCQESLRRHMCPRVSEAE